MFFNNRHNLKPSPTPFSSLQAQGIAGAEPCIVAYKQTPQTDPRLWGFAPPAEGVVGYWLMGQCVQHVAQGNETNGKQAFADMTLDNRGFQRSGLHEVVVIQGTNYGLADKSIFDPSFGVLKTAATIQLAGQAWEDQMLAGYFYRTVSLNNGKYLFKDGELIAHAKGNSDLDFKFNRN